jgi:hypothetical protein
MLQAVLIEEAVQSVGNLLTWLQQQPQGLQLARMAQPVCNTSEYMWLLCCSIMRQIAVVISGLAAADATTVQLVVIFTAQLQQSGEP